MKKEEFLKVIDKLIEQGYKKELIDSYILASRRNYVDQAEIYKALKDFIIDDFSYELKNFKEMNWDLFKMVTIFSQAVHVHPTMEGAMNYEKENPIVVDYIKNNIKE